jgi:hypothetical protein
LEEKIKDESGFSGKSRKFVCVASATQADVVIIVSAAGAHESFHGINNFAKRNA